MAFQKHDIPLSAIPCLQYMKALDIEKTVSLEDKENGVQDNGKAGETEQVGVMVVVVVDGEGR